VTDPSEPQRVTVTRRRGRRPRWVAASLLSLVLALGWLALGGRAASADTTTTPVATTAAVTTTKPARPTSTTAGAATTAPATASTGAPHATSSSSGKLIVVVALLALVVAVVAVIITLVRSAGRRRQAKEARAAWEEHERQLVAGARWFHEELSVELTRTDRSPQELAAEWRVGRRRVDNLVLGLAGHAAVAPDELRASGTRRLAQACTSLRDALDQDLARPSPAGGGLPEPSPAGSDLAVTDARDRLLTAILGIVDPATPS